MTGGAETGDDEPTVPSRVLLVSGYRASASTAARSIVDHCDGTPASAVGVVLGDSTAPWTEAFESSGVQTIAIDVDTCTRSTTVSSNSGESERADSTPASLSAIGTRVLEVLDSQDTPVVLWIDSLSVLLAHFERERVFRFVHVAGELAARRGGTCYLSVSAGRHDPETIEIFGTICNFVRLDDMDDPES